MSKGRMNKDTKFLLDRIDQNYKEVSEKIDQNHKEVMIKIDHISTWKHKLAGASVVVTTFISAAVSAIIAFLTGK